MDKLYTPQKIKSLRDLHTEQERVRAAYKDMEANWASTFFSLKTISTFLWGRFSSSGKKRQHNNTPTSVLSAKRSPRKSYKKLTRYLIAWQTASLLIFAGSNIALHFKKKKRKKHNP